MTEIDIKEGASSAEAGKSFYREKKYLQAAESFSRAAEVYAAGGAVLLAAEMRNNQGVALLMAKKPRQALDAVEGTSEIFQEAGEVTKSAMALANQAAAYKDLGERDQAVAYFSQAADRFRSAGEDDMYLQTMQSISSLKMKNRNVMGAYYSMQSGLSALKKPTWRQKLLKELLSIPDKLLGK
jgi:tetratricopeptide (TPR) repeat protein